MTGFQAALIGSPVSHSLSPRIFSFLSHRIGVPQFDYRSKNISPNDLEDFILKIRDQESLVGFNVTIPYKERILRLLDKVSPEAENIGAVNVVHKKANQLIGYNTDVHGVAASLEKYDYQIKGKNAFVLGAGGGARAIAYVLGRQKAKQVFFFNNDFTRSKELIEKFSKLFPYTQFCNLTQNECLIDSIDLWVNATPLGMKGKPVTQKGQLALNYFISIYEIFGKFFSKTAYAFDLIYIPQETPFLNFSKKIGLKPIGGLDMLIGQALQTWEIWFGPIKDLPLIREELKDYLQHCPLFLTGFMGAGKSTVGSILAKKLGWKFIDMDDLIVQETNMSIPELFKEKGESFFRKIESKMIQKYSFSSRSIIALGGGALSCLMNRSRVEKSGLLIFLSAQPETLLKRMKADLVGRPLVERILKEANTEEQKLRIIELLEEREGAYNQCTYKVETDFLSPQAVAKSIIEIL